MAIFRCEFVDVIYDNDFSLTDTEFSEFEPHDSCKKNFYRKNAHKTISKQLQQVFLSDIKKWYMEGEIGVSRGDWC